MRSFTLRSIVTLVALGAASSLAACSSSSSTETTVPTGGDAGTDATPADCPSTGTGTLSIEVTGLPDGVDAKVTVTGPPTSSVTKTTSLSLPGGSYTIAAGAVTVSDPIVRAVHRASDPAPSCVRDGATTTVTIAYERVATSNALWLTNQNGAQEVVGLRSAKLGASAMTSADVASKIIQPVGLAFDKEGNLWTVGAKGGERRLERYAASSFAASGEPTPDVVITGAALNFGAPSVTGLAFDSSGDLWVATPTAQKVVRYASSALRASGSPAPVDAITGVKAQQVAFDAAGNLWATADGNEVIEFVASRLASPSTTPPDVVLTAKTPLPVVTPHQSPSGLAFDASNNLWVAYNGSTVVRFSPAERAASADLTPAVQVGLSVLALAEGLAFDESGGLWFAYSQGKIARLGPDQLAASATVTPSTVIEATPISSGNAVAFYPAPAGVPIYGKP